MKMAAKLRGFSDYIEVNTALPCLNSFSPSLLTRSVFLFNVMLFQRTKASTPGIGNVGLRELLMEPVQRIPRYKLLFEGQFLFCPPLCLSSGRLNRYPDDRHSERHARGRSQPSPSTGSHPTGQQDRTLRDRRRTTTSGHDVGSRTSHRRLPRRPDQ